MPALQNTRANSIFRLQLVLLVSLLINILAEDTIIGRAYTHLLGLNEGIGKTVMAGDPPTVTGSPAMTVLPMPSFRPKRWVYARPIIVSSARMLISRDTNRTNWSLKIELARVFCNAGIGALLGCFFSQSF